MIGFAEIIRSVYGCWQVACGKPSGLQWLDCSSGGVRRSFWGPALVLPGVLALQAIDGAFAKDIAWALAVQLIAFVIGCTAFPLAVAQISDEIGCGANYARYLVAYNWSAVIQISVLLPVALLAWVMPGTPLAVLSLVVTVALLFYQAYIARIALGVTSLAAGLLVLLDILIGTLVQTAADRIAG
ncbi:hypothetical protein [Magnetospirillum molischianum]|uniref:Uncharacterized protein n=1 Tax=Magnetospirillum molischianum DSM 120 TaxID=1150626 RepID=H8FTK9_MAGML|nr:hypothetical protein [Magnetospirillum molischianum]CCG41697.1 conserved membrane hypothetical protein [Magnetospirillum molischianum DSM 120]